MDRFAQTADAETLLNGLAKQWADVSGFIRKIQGPIGDLKQIEIVRQELAKRLQPFGDIINRVITTFKPKTAASLRADLILLADDLDRREHSDMADVLDGIIKDAAGMPMQKLLQELSAIHHGLSNMLPAAAQPERTPEGLINPWGEPIDLDVLKAWIADLGKLIARYMPQARAASADDLVRVADYLDVNGFTCLADTVDVAAELLVKCADYTYVPRMRGDMDETKNPDSIKPPHEANLSMRYCPDHVGVQTARVAEHVYQCPLDGKVYNYQTGYVNYQGQRVLGGSVAEQTPPTSDFGGVPMRVFDSRQSILNTIY